jgi:hypothetical protein
VEHAVLTLAPCPVLVVREKTLWPRTASLAPRYARAAEANLGNDALAHSETGSRVQAARTA